MQITEIVTFDIWISMINIYKLVKWDMLKFSSQFQEFFLSALSNSTASMLSRIWSKNAFSTRLPQSFVDALLKGLKKDGFVSLDALNEEQLVL